MSSELRPEVRAFAEAMEMRLRKYEADCGAWWKTMSLTQLQAYLMERTARLSCVMEICTPDEIARQAVLVGVAALFVADVMGALAAAVPPAEEME